MHESHLETLGLCSLWHLVFNHNAGIGHCTLIAVSWAYKMDQAFPGDSCRAIDSDDRVLSER